MDFVRLLGRLGDTPGADWTNKNIRSDWGTSSFALSPAIEMYHAWSALYRHCVVALGMQAWQHSTRKHMLTGSPILTLCEIGHQFCALCRFRQGELK